VRRSASVPRAPDGRPLRRGHGSLIVITLAKARAIALSLPETREQDHHGIPSFRVRNRIFAAVPERDHIRVIADERAIRAAVATAPAVCEAFYWGQRLACVVVTLRTVKPKLVRELLVDAWLRKAPVTLARQLSEHPAPPSRA